MVLGARARHPPMAEERIEPGHIRSVRKLTEVGTGPTFSTVGNIKSTRFTERSLWPRSHSPNVVFGQHDG